MEPFGPEGRIDSPADYWLMPLPGTRLTPELQAFLAWVRTEAQLTAKALAT